MDKPADFEIWAVRYDASHSQIVSVKRRAVFDGGYGEPHITSKTDVVDSIRSGKSHITIYEKDNKWLYGSPVRIVKGTNFIRTDNNETRADNLGNLPEF